MTPVQATHTGLNPCNVIGFLEKELTEERTDKFKDFVGKFIPGQLDETIMDALLPGALITGLKFVFGCEDVVFTSPNEPEAPPITEEEKNALDSEGAIVGKNENAVG